MSSRHLKVCLLKATFPHESLYLYVYDLITDALWTQKSRRVLWYRRNQKSTAEILLTPLTSTLITTETAVPVNILRYVVSCPLPPYPKSLDCHLVMNSPVGKLFLQKFF